MFSSHLGPWFETAKDALFQIEFLIVQVFLIVHLVRTLFWRKVVVSVDSEQKAKLLPSPYERGTQARAGDCGGNPSGAASEDGRRSVRGTARQSENRCNDCRCRSMGGEDHAEDRQFEY